MFRNTLLKDLRGRLAVMHKASFAHDTSAASKSALRPCRSRVGLGTVPFFRFGKRGTVPWTSDGPRGLPPRSAPAERMGLSLRGRCVQSCPARTKLGFAGYWSSNRRISRGRRGCPLFRFGKEGLLARRSSDVSERRRVPRSRTTRNSRPGRTLSPRRRRDKCESSMDAPRTNRRPVP